MPFARRACSHLCLALLVSSLARGPVYAAAPSLVPSATFSAKVGQSLLVVIAPLDARARAQVGALEHAAEAAVEASGRFDLLRGVEVWDERAARTRRARAADGESLVRDGQKALDDLDSQKATQLFADAQVAYRQSDLTRSFDGYVDASLLKAAAHAVSGENPQAKSELERLFTVSSRPKLSDSYFPPDLLKFGEAQRKLVSTAKGKLTVRTDPPGAPVWVDGSYRGTSPVTVEGLAGGKHLTTVALAGYQLATDELLPGEELVRLKASEGAGKLLAGVDRIVKDPSGPQRDAATRELGTAARADQVLVLVAKKSLTGDKLEVTAVRLEVRDGHNAAYREGTLAPEELGAFARSLFDKDQPREGKQIVTHFESAGAAAGGGPSTRKLVGYGLLGLGAVGLVSGVFFGVQAKAAQNQYDQTLQVETVKSADLASRGRTFAIIADVSFVVGIAAAAAGGVLAFTRLGSGASASPSTEVVAADAQARPADDRKAGQDDLRKRDDNARRADEDARLKADADRKRDDEAKKKAGEETRKKSDADARKDDEARKKADADRKKAEDEARLKADADRKKDDEAKKKADEEAKKRSEADRKKDDEAKKKADEEAKKKSEADRKKDDEAKKKADAELKKKADDDARRKAEDEAAQKKADDDARKKADADKRKGEDQKKAEEDRRRAEEEARATEETRAKEAQRKKDEEKKKEEERRRAEEEAKKKAGEPKSDQKKKEEDDLRNY